MLPIIDFKVDESDDISLLGDIEYDYNFSDNVVRTAQRRITARADDFSVRNVGVGAEKYIYKHAIENIKYLLQADISRALTLDNLFKDGEFLIKVLDILADKKLPVLVKLKSPTSKYSSFKTIINQHNQRNYK